MTSLLRAAPLLVVLLLAIAGCGSGTTVVDASMGSDAGADATAADAGAGDAATIDAAGDDAATPDAATTDAAASDAATVDASSVDASSVDASRADTGSTGVLGFGATCGADAQCASGTCWNYNEIDPFCFGTGCTIPCTTDTQCREAATAADAPTPTAATCNTTTHECDLLGTGLVAVLCS